MNERIKELAEQADYYAYEQYDVKKVPYSVLFNQKFAELIVMECIGCCEQVISDPVPESVDTWLNGGSQCIDEIKQHFGVQE
jgi:hypothetical protein